MWRYLLEACNHMKFNKTQFKRGPQNRFFFIYKGHHIDKKQVQWCEKQRQWAITCSWYFFAVRFLIIYTLPQFQSDTNWTKKTLVQSTLTSKGIKKDRTNLCDLDVGYLILLNVQNLHDSAIRCTKRGLWGPRDWIGGLGWNTQILLSRAPSFAESPLVSSAEPPPTSKKKAPK